MTPMRPMREPDVPHSPGEMWYKSTETPVDDLRKKPINKIQNLYWGILDLNERKLSVILNRIINTNFWSLVYVYIFWYINQPSFG
jgi:hypothetical protein